MAETIAPRHPTEFPSAAALPQGPRALPGDRRRGSVSPRRGGPDTAAKPDKTRRRFAQLVICLIVLGGVLLLKIVSPESAAELKRTLAANIGGGVDYKAAFASVGQALSDGGDIREVFQVLSDALFAGKEPVEAGPAGADSPAPPPTVSPSGTAAGTEALGAPDILPMGTIYLSGWEISLSEADAQDDTPPVPFGMAVPTNVDYTRYELPFPWAAPLSGRVSDGFGYRTHPVYGETLFHYGMDIAAPSGTDIRSFADGVVTATGYSDSYGNYVEVLHDGGYATFYAHCSQVLARDGQAVKLGDVVARVGMTGTA
ncbi:MAG: M23 family metallopeptidase, partial [Oscillospiraceae bacterium]|nr:M23 family metallopeptidase [Oscillospiraceae bacterium]